LITLVNKYYVGTYEEIRELCRKDYEIIEQLKIEENMGKEVK